MFDDKMRKNRVRGCKSSPPHIPALYTALTVYSACKHRKKIKTEEKAVGRRC